MINTAWKVSVFGVFWSECGKIRARKTPNTDTFYAVQCLRTKAKIDCVIKNQMTFTICQSNWRTRNCPRYLIGVLTRLKADATEALKIFILDRNTWTIIYKLILFKETQLKRSASVLLSFLMYLASSVA